MQIHGERIVTQPDSANVNSHKQYLNLTSLKNKDSAHLKTFTWYDHCAMVK